jgi:hypothetical protein
MRRAVGQGEVRGLAYKNLLLQTFIGQLSAKFLILIKQVARAVTKLVIFPSWLFIMNLNLIFGIRLSLSPACPLHKWPSDRFPGRLK